MARRSDGSNPVAVRDPADRAGIRVPVEDPPTALGARRQRGAVKQELIEQLEEDQ
jgi:hypothetical protein